MTRSALVPIAVLLLSATPSFALELKPGTAFPLSDGAGPTLISVEVHRITSDNTIDLAVSLKPPAKMPTSDREFLTQVGEFCLRYQKEIVAAAVPAEERNRMNVFVPLYRVPVPGKSNQFQEAGFAFRVINGQCSLGAPFPSQLKSETQKRAKQQAGSN
jgi:hypothetical protein